MISHVPRLLIAACLIVFALDARPALAGGGTLKITVLDKDTRQPIPFRIHLKNHAGVPHKIGKLPFWHDHLTAPGTLELSLRKGNYTFEVERGLEYLWQQGYFKSTMAHRTRRRSRCGGSSRCTSMAGTPAICASSGRLKTWNC